MASPSSCLRLLSVGIIGQQIPCLQDPNEEPSADGSVDWGLCCWVAPWSSGPANCPGRSLLSCSSPAGKSVALLMDSGWSCPQLLWATSGKSLVSFLCLCVTVWGESWPEPAVISCGACKIPARQAGSLGHNRWLSMTVDSGATSVEVSDTESLCHLYADAELLG